MLLNRKETILRIRNAEMNDVAALSELMGELGYPTTEKQMATRLMNIQQDSNYHTFVAVENQEIVGMIVFLEECLMK